MKNLKLLVSIIAVSVLSTACGNMTAPSSSTGTVVSSLNASGNNASGSSLAEKCSLAPNVMSLSDNGDVQSQYRACANGSTTGSMQLFKADAAQVTVCIFPARVTNQSISLFVSNPYAPVESRYVSQCTTTRNPGIVVNFSGLNFNAVYVVSANDANNMAACISSGQVASCAAYMGFQFSYGQFK